MRHNQQNIKKLKEKLKGNKKMNIKFEPQDSSQERRNAREDRMKFFPIEEKGVYVTKLCDIKNDAYLAIDKLVESNSNFLFVCNSHSSLSIPESFRGKAKVNKDDGDTYVEEQGKKLATDRCMAKYHKSFDKKMNVFYNDLMNLVDAVEHYCEKRDINLTRNK